MHSKNIEQQTTMNDKIWFEFVHHKYGDEYLILYIERLRQTRKRINVLTIIFSTTGILSWKLWTYLPAVTSGLVAILQLFKLIENKVIATDADIEKFSELRMMQYDITNRYEKLWIEYDCKKITEEQATDRFFEFRDIAKEIKSLSNKLDIKETVKLQNLADIKTNNYLKQYYLNQKTT